MKRILLLAAVVLSFSATPALAKPSPGAPGLGDRLFPTLGNGGYDVQHYDLALRYATGAPSQPIDGTVTILAKATQDLSRFDLNLLTVLDVIIEERNLVRAGLRLTPP